MRTALANSRSHLVQTLEDAWYQETEHWPTGCPRVHSDCQSSIFTVYRAIHRPRRETSISQLVEFFMRTFDTLDSTFALEFETFWAGATTLLYDRQTSETTRSNTEDVSVEHGVKRDIVTRMLPLSLVLGDHVEPSSLTPVYDLTEEGEDYEIEIDYSFMDSRCLVEVPKEVNWEAAATVGHAYSELFGYQYDLDVEEEP